MENHIRKKLICAMLAILLVSSHVLSSFSAEAATRKCKILLYSSITGKQIGYCTVDYDSSFIIPVPPKSRFNYSMYNFLGWDKVRGKKDHPSYIPGKPYQITSNLKLYDVAFPLANDTVSIPQHVPSQFSSVIMVGDSRTWHIEIATYQQRRKRRINNVYFVTRTGGGIINCLENISDYQPGKYYPLGPSGELFQLVERLNQPSGKPIVIILNLGVGETDLNKYQLSDISKNAYHSIRILYELADTLKDYNVKLYYASIAPANDVLSSGRMSSRIIYSFNERLYPYISRHYTWLNFYEKMYTSGFAFCPSKDGIHYSRNTSTRLYNFLINGIK